MSGTLYSARGRSNLFSNCLLLISVDSEKRPGGGKPDHRRGQSNSGGGGGGKNKNDQLEKSVAPPVEMMAPLATVGGETTTQGPQKSSGKSYKDKRRERQMARQQGQGGVGEETPQQDS